jgi:hypothetical protein
MLNNKSMKKQFITKIALGSFVLSFCQMTYAEHSKKTPSFKEAKFPESCLSAAKKTLIASTNTYAETTENDVKDIKVVSMKVISSGTIPPSDTVEPISFSAKLSTGAKVNAHLERGGCNITYFKK